MELVFHHYPNAFPIPKAAPAAMAPMIIVSAMEIYHFIPPTQLLASPSTPRKKAATTIVAITMLSSIVYMPMPLATMEGMIGVSPKMTKLKKVTMLLVNGFSSPAMSWSSSIIMIFRKPSWFLLSICTISSETAGSRPISLYRWIISAFSAYRSFSISWRSLAYSCNIYSSSLFVPK
jgi:hypothetical protein